VRLLANVFVCVCARASVCAACVRVYTHTYIKVCRALSPRCLAWCVCVSLCD
jgi:hypothetical protein